jgi:hypothetical protein
MRLTGKGIFSLVIHGGPVKKYYQEWAAATMVSPDSLKDP